MSHRGRHSQCTDDGHALCSASCDGPAGAERPRERDDRRGAASGEVAGYVRAPHRMRPRAHKARAPYARAALATQRLEMEQRQLQELRARESAARATADEAAASVQEAEARAEEAGKAATAAEGSQERKSGVAAKALAGMVRDEWALLTDLSALTPPSAGGGNVARPRCPPPTGPSEARPRVRSGRD